MSSAAAIQQSDTLQPVPKRSADDIARIRKHLEANPDLYKVFKRLRDLNATDTVLTIEEIEYCISHHWYRLRIYNEALPHATLQAAMKRPGITPAEFDFLEKELSREQIIVALPYLIGLRVTFDHEVNSEEQIRNATEYADVFHPCGVVTDYDWDDKLGNLDVYVQLYDNAEGWRACGNLETGRGCGASLYHRRVGNEITFREVSICIIGRREGTGLLEDGILEFHALPALTKGADAPFRWPENVDYKKLLAVTQKLLQSRVPAAAPETIALKNFFGTTEKPFSTDGRNSLGYILCEDETDRALSGQVIDELSQVSFNPPQQDIQSMASQPVPAANTAPPLNPANAAAGQPAPGQAPGQQPPQSGKEVKSAASLDGGALGAPAGAAGGSAGVAGAQGGGSGSGSAPGAPGAPGAAGGNNGVNSQAGPPGADGQGGQPGGAPPANGQPPQNGQGGTADTFGGLGKRKNRDPDSLVDRVGFQFESLYNSSGDNKDLQSRILKAAPVVHELIGQNEQLMQGMEERDRQIKKLKTVYDVERKRNAKDLSTSMGFFDAIDPKQREVIDGYGKGTKSVDEYLAVLGEVTSKAAMTATVMAGAGAFQNLGGNGDQHPIAVAAAMINWGQRVLSGAPMPSTATPMDLSSSNGAPAQRPAAPPAAVHQQQEHPREIAAPAAQMPPPPARHSRVSETTEEHYETPAQGAPWFSQYFRGATIRSFAYNTAYNSQIEESNAAASQLRNSMDLTPRREIESPAAMTDDQLKQPAAPAALPAATTAQVPYSPADVAAKRINQMNGANLAQSPEVLSKAAIDPSQLGRNGQQGGQYGQGNGNGQGQGQQYGNGGSRTNSLGKARLIGDMRSLTSGRTLYEDEDRQLYTAQRAEAVSAPRSDPYSQMYEKRGSSRGGARSSDDGGDYGSDRGGGSDRSRVTRGDGGTGPTRWSFSSALN